MFMSANNYPQRMNIGFFAQVRQSDRLTVCLSVCAITQKVLYRAQKFSIERLSMKMNEIDPVNEGARVDKVNNSGNLKDIFGCIVAYSSFFSFRQFLDGKISGDDFRRWFCSLGRGPVRKYFLGEICL